MVSLALFSNRSGLALTLAGTPHQFDPKQKLYLLVLDTEFANGDWTQLSVTSFGCRLVSATPLGSSSDVLLQTTELGPYRTRPSVQFCSLVKPPATTVWMSRIVSSCRC